MTNEELAQHWKVSLKEAQNISDIINHQYSVDLVPVHGETSDFWQVVLRAYDGRNHYILMEEGTRFYDKSQAIVLGTHWAQKIKISDGQADLMGVPKDAFLAINPINGYNQAIEQQTSARKTICPDRQHD